MALMDGLLSYACGDVFRPQMKLGPEVLASLLDAQNRAQAPVVAGYVATRDRSGERVEWHNIPLTIEFGSKIFYQVNDGDWQEGIRLEIDRTGITKFVTKPSANAALPRPREIGIDLIPPRIALLTTPELRRHVRSLLSRFLPGLSILSYNEISPDTRILAINR